MMVRLDERCRVGLPPDIDAAWERIDIIVAFGPYASAFQATMHALWAHSGGSGWGWVGP